MLQQLLPEDSIKIGFEAPTREAALTELIASIPSKKLKSCDKAELLDILLEREAKGTTAIGDGVALPHGMSRCIKEPVAFLAISRQGIDYPSLDGEKVSLIFLLLIPATDQALENKRKIFSVVGRVLRDRFLQQRLKISDTPSEVCEILVREQNALLTPARVSA